jgi:rod shape-determining protein MreD
MIYYILLPFAAILLVVLQITLADIFFSGWLTLELSLVAVIYAGFRLDLVKGITLACVMGFVFDCLSGATLGLFTLFHLLIFVLVFFVSLRIASEKLYIIAFVSWICSLLESLVLVLLYAFVFQFDLSGDVLLVSVLQALLTSVLSVGFFHVMSRTEGLKYGKTIQTPQRTWTGGVSSKT